MGISFYCVNNDCLYETKNYDKDLILSDDTIHFTCPKCKNILYEEDEFFDKYKIMYYKKTAEEEYIEEVYLKEEFELKLKEMKTELRDKYKELGWELHWYDKTSQSLTENSIHFKLGKKIFTDNYPPYIYEINNINNEFIPCEYRNCKREAKYYVEIPMCMKGVYCEEHKNNEDLGIVIHG